MAKLVLCHVAKLSKIKQMWHLQMICSKFAIEVNPFFRPVLYCLSSSAPVPSNVENDILMSDEIGKKAHKQLVQDRLIDKTVRFHAPVKKQNLKTFANQAKTSLVQGKARKKRFWATCYTGTAA